jgi:hypothetical protein
VGRALTEILCAGLDTLDRPCPREMWDKLPYLAITATTDPQKIRVAVDDFGAFQKVFVLKGSKLEISRSLPTKERVMKNLDRIY